MLLDSWLEKVLKQLICTLSFVKLDCFSNPGETHFAGRQSHLVCSPFGVSVNEEDDDKEEWSDDREG